MGWGGGGGGRESEGSTAETARKRPERPWTAARTMEVLRRCPLAIAQRLVHHAIAVSTAVLGRVTRTMSVALLLINNPKRKKSNFCSPAHGLFWANLSPAPPPFSRSRLEPVGFQLLIAFIWYCSPLSSRLTAIACDFT